MDIKGSQMLIQVIQDVAQGIANDGLPTGGVVGLFIALAVGIIFVLDRFFFMLKGWGLIKVKSGNPNGAVKIAELHDWYTPKNVGEKPPCMTWLPIDEVIAQQEKTVDLLEKILAKVSYEEPE